MRPVAGAVAALVIGGLVGAPTVFAHGHMKRMSSADVQRAQQTLQDEGYDPGPVDGKMGPQTRKAVKKFQHAKNFKATGHLDHRTTEALGIESEGATSGTPGKAGRRMHEASRGMQGPHGTPTPAPPASENE